MDDLTPDRIKDMLESVIKSNTAAWTAQSQYFDELVKRNMSSFSTLSDARVASLKEIGDSLTFNQAFEANVAYENAMREELQKLSTDNEKAWDDLQTELKSIYLTDPADDE